jgi:hypothetical protein
MESDRMSEFVKRIKMIFNGETVIDTGDEEE